MRQKNKVFRGLAFSFLITILIIMVFQITESTEEKVSMFSEENIIYNLSSFIGVWLIVFTILFFHSSFTGTPEKVSVKQVYYVTSDTIKFRDKNAVLAIPIAKKHTKNSKIDFSKEIICFIPENESKKYEMNKFHYYIFLWDGYAREVYPRDSNKSWHDVS